MSLFPYGNILSQIYNAHNFVFQNLTETGPKLTLFVKFKKVLLLQSYHFFLFKYFRLIIPNFDQLAKISLSNFIATFLKKIFFFNQLKTQQM